MPKVSYTVPLQTHEYCSCHCPFCKWCMNCNIICRNCGKEDDGEEPLGIFCDPPAKDFDDSEVETPLPF